MPSTRDIAFIGCRLLALYALYGALLSFAHTVLTVAQTLTVATSGFGQFILSYGTTLAVNLAVFLVLWFGADWIAGKVVAGTAEAPREVPGAWSRQSVLSLLLAVAGLWILIHNLPSLLFYLALIIPDPADQIAKDFSIDTERLISAVLTTVFGLLCVVGAGGIARFIAKLRGWSAGRQTDGA